MRKKLNECVGCKGLGLPCFGSSCPNRNVIRLYCDRCGEETNLYYYNGEELCIECITKTLEEVKE